MQPSSQRLRSRRALAASLLLQPSLPSCVPLASWQSPSPPRTALFPLQERPAVPAGVRCAALNRESSGLGEAGDRADRQGEIEDPPAGQRTPGPASYSWRPWGRQDCSVRVLRVIGKWARTGLLLALG